jgi:GNAT superfamily N-acetyltransferase
VDLVIRTATVNDAAAVAVMLRELGYEQAGDPGDRLRLWTGDPAGHVSRGQRRRRAQGRTRDACDSTLRTQGWWAQIVALVTARRQGVGRRLVQQAEAKATTAGCDTMMLSSSREPAAAHEFYRSLGYLDRCLDHAQFVRSLS